MQRSPFASSGTSFHLFPVLLMRYNYLQLILCFRKPLRGLCRGGHLYIFIRKKTRHRNRVLSLFISTENSLFDDYHLLDLVQARGIQSVEVDSTSTSFTLAIYSIPVDGMISLSKFNGFDNFSTDVVYS